MFGLSSTIRMPAIVPEPISCLCHLAYSKPCRLFSGDFQRFAEFTNPFLQNNLVLWLYPRKNDSHVTIARGIGYLAEGRESPPLAHDSYSQLGSSREGFAGIRAAAVQTQICDPALRLNLRLHVHQFDAGHKRVAPSAWTFGMNHWILELVAHISIFRKDWRNNSVISNVVVELFSATQTRVCTTSIIRR